MNTNEFFRGIPYKKEHFSRMLPLPSLAEFEGFGPHITQLPYVKFRLWAMEQLTVPEGKTLAPGGIALLMSDKKNLDEKVAQWLIKHHSLEEGTPEFEKALANLDLMYGPSEMAEGWASPGFIHVKIDCFTDLPKCSRSCRGCG